MTLEQDLEIGEYYRNRTTQRIYVIININDYDVEYLISEDDLNKADLGRANAPISEFKLAISKATFSRLGKLNESELAKYLLQRQ